MGSSGNAFSARQRRGINPRITPEPKRLASNCSTASTSCGGAAKICGRCADFAFGVKYLAAAGLILDRGSRTSDRGSRVADFLEGIGHFGQKPLRFEPGGLPTSLPGPLVASYLNRVPTIPARAEALLPCRGNCPTLSIARAR
jgi:hypothetical protein